MPTPELDAAVSSFLGTPGLYGARLTGAGLGACVIAPTHPDAGTGGWVVKAVDGASVKPIR